VNFTLTANSELEQLVMNGSGLTGTGNALANLMFSYGGPNTLAGGQGNDTYFVHNSSDVIQENPSEGLDRVYSSTSFTLSDPDVEELALTNPFSIGIGNTSANGLISLANNTGLVAGLDTDVDTLFFLAAWGTSSAEQLNLNDDYLVIQGSLFGSNRQAVLNATSESSGSAVIDAGGGNTLMLTGISKANFEAHIDHLLFA
jgi:hypothetical protein